jgi:pilus assembly protein CpaF
VFAIIISEKGGAERRESFDKSEINVGRVQGNDLMLPKGNVSKHHARLLFRDGRFIVTDLKSTNGTYVNGRKIAQATIVREGDKIYIGDFVLRLETNEASASPPEEQPTGEADAVRAVPRDNAPPRPPLMATLQAAGQPPGRPLAPNASGAPPQMQAASYPLDQEPDESAPLQQGRVQTGGGPPVQAGPGMGPAPSGPGGPPRPMTLPLNPMAAPMNPMSPPMVGGRMPPLPPGGMPQQSPPGMPMQPFGGPPQVAPTQGPPPPLPQGAPPPQGAPAPFVPVASQSSQRPAVQVAASATSAPPPQPRPSAAPARMPLKESPAQAGRRLALTMLMGRIAEAVDLSALRANPVVPDELVQQIERAARDQATAMRDEGEAPEDVDLDAVVRDVQRELVGLGSIGPLLDDEDVSEIHCVRHDQLFTVRSGGTAQESVAFSSEEALRRVIGRLAQQSGEAWRSGETVIERRLPRASLTALAPPRAASHVLSIRKRRRIESTLEDLVRAAALSRPMAQFLEACTTARANVLVSGVAPGIVLAALAASGGQGERVCIVQDVEEIAVSNAHVVALSIADSGGDGEDTVRAAARLRPSRLVNAQLAGGVAAATVDAMAEGSEGILASIAGPTLRQALSRLVAQLILHRPALGLDATRDIVGEGFDVAVEVGVMPDGRHRVTRIAELAGSDAKGIVARDVFVYTADPQGGEGTHTATGVVPRLANDLAARGIKLDPAMFKRAGR